MSEHVPEYAADPKASPLVEDEVREDEEYEPENISQALDSQIRVTAASIAVQIPWNPTEPVTDEGIKARLNLIYAWLTEGVNKDLA